MKINLADRRSTWPKAEQPVPARGAQGLWVPNLNLLHDVEVES